MKGRRNIGKAAAAIFFTLAMIVSLIPLAASLSIVEATITDNDVPIVTILSSDETGITLRVDFPGFRESQVQVDERVFNVLEIPGCGKTGEIGKPALPKYGTMVNVPFDVPISVYVLETESTDYEGYFVYPAQEPGEGQVYPPFPTPPFYIDEEFYKIDQLYPAMIVEYEPTGTLRDVRVLPLRLVAFQHNPVQKLLRFYSSITVRISFEEIILKAAGEAKSSPYFEDIYSSLVGYEPPAFQGKVSEAGNPDGCDFLIITDASLVDAANTLAARRNAQGLSTLVRTTADTGTTAVAIKAYIQNAYDTWSPRPSYLLLLGDAELIPTFYHTVHYDAGIADLYAPADFHTGTDLYYAIMNGPEAAPPYYDEYWTPDIFHGRIPVDTVAEANVVIDKIIDYEDNQWIGGENTTLVSGCFQDRDGHGDTYEDRRFILTSEEIRDFLLGEGFNVERLYALEDPLVTPMYYNNGTYDLGLALPADLQCPAHPCPNYSWDADATDINNAINDGRFVVFHRDHGGSLNRPTSGIEGWGDPEYEDTDVPALNNADHLPVILSINCETGWFDGETDDYAGWSFDCLCEAFLRESDGGAVGVIGATRITCSGWNDDLAKGFVDAIWPNLDTAHGPAVAQLRMGEVLNYGKWYMYTIDGWPWTDIKKHEYEMFHYFGDPTMEFKIPILLEPPIADADGPYTGPEGSAITFDASGSTDPDGTIALYEWDWDNDGVYDESSATPTITHEWGDDYTGTVALRVTDNDGLLCVTPATTTVTVNNLPPVTMLLAQPRFYVDQQGWFRDAATDPGSDDLTFTWNWDDGTPEMITTHLNNPPTPDPYPSPGGTYPFSVTESQEHMYTDLGMYMVTVTVEDDDGGKTVEETTVEVVMIPPAVGGEVRPVSEIGVLAPWIGLAAAMIAGAAIVWRRRRAQS